MPKIIIDNDKVVKISESCTVILKNKDINIEYGFKEDSKVLLFNDFDGDVTLKDSGNIENCNVTLSYLQLDKYDLNQNTKIDVNANSNLEVNSTYLGTNNKNVVFDLYNKQSDSTVNITNNIVCLDDADFSLDCIGTIVKGAKRSKCHQKSHCLTIDSPKKARVLPVLNIDENDVEASHSLSSGTIDEEVLFYMNSRGMNKKEALNLLLKSYLMPNDDFYNDYEDGTNIQKQAIQKVDEICSM